MCKGAPDRPTSHGHAERYPAMSLYIILAATSIAGIIGSIIVTARDGYRRQPRETFARTV